MVNINMTDIYIALSILHFSSATWKHFFPKIERIYKISVERQVDCVEDLNMRSIGKTQLPVLLFRLKMRKQDEQKALKKKKRKR